MRISLIKNSFPIFDNCLCLFIKCGQKPEFVAIGTSNLFAHKWKMNKKWWEHKVICEAFEISNIHLSNCVTVWQAILLLLNVSSCASFKFTLIPWYWHQTSLFVIILLFSLFFLHFICESYKSSLKAKIQKVIIPISTANKLQEIMFTRDNKLKILKKASKRLPKWFDRGKCQ